MSYRGIGVGLIATACLWLGNSSGRLVADEEPGWGYSGMPTLNSPTPLGPSKPDTGGIYGAMEFLFMNSNRNIGHQIVAKRGFTDTNGTLSGTINKQGQVVNGTPGTFIGSGQNALNTDSWGRSTWTPGWRATIGYKMEDGSSISFSYQHLITVKSTVSATGVTPGFVGPNDLSDTFLFSPVFNYSPAFSGPPNKVQPDPNRPNTGNAVSGLWNGASEMNLVYIQRYDTWDITYRAPVMDNEYWRSYALAGARRAWIWENFRWDTIDLQFDGNGGGPQDQVRYTNILSQVMYGPFVGVGNEVYLGNSFAASADITASVLLDIVKERASYALMDGSTESKRGRMDYSIVPNVNASINLWWYPIEGVQVRAGYNVQTFFNSIYMKDPVGFNAGAIDPAYAHRAIRLFSGFQFGVAYSF